MATIAVGDIHGNLPALNDLLGQLRGEVADDDTLVFIGDYIDRGPDIKVCVVAILGFQRDVSAKASTCVATMRIEDQSINALLWGANGFPDDYRGTETVLYRLFQSARHQGPRTDLQQRWTVEHLA